MSSLTQNLQASFNLTQWDLVLFAGFIAGVLAFVFLLGRKRVVTVLLCVYIALAIVNFIPEIDNMIMDLNSNGDFWYHLAIFSVSVALLYFLLSPTVINSPVDRGAISNLHFVLIVILIVGLVTSVVLSFFPSTVTINFSDIVHTIFLSLWAKVFWMVMGLIFLAFLSRR